MANVHMSLSTGRSRETSQIRCELGQRPGGRSVDSMRTQIQAVGMASAKVLWRACPWCMNNSKRGPWGWKRYGRETVFGL